jgi:hypothetical protein
MLSLHKSKEMTSITCTRTFSTNSIAAGQTFQITYRFDYQPAVVNGTILSFSDNSWGGLLKIPSAGLNLQTTGNWVTAPISGNSSPDTFFAFTNQPVISALFMSGTSTASVIIDVEGVSAGIVPAANFTFANMNVTFTSNTDASNLSSNSDVTITAMVCVAEGTLVALADGSKLPIEQLRPGHLLVNHAGRTTRLSAAIRVEQPTTSLIQLDQGSLGLEVPSAPLRIRPGHPLLVAGKEVLPEALLDLPGVAQVQLEKPVHVYTLLTEQRSFVEMQGALVGTWSEAAWQNFIESDSRSAHLHWSTLE